jgi:hypothetical protein
MTTTEKLAAAKEVIEAMEKAGQISVINWLYTVDGELPDDEVRVYVAIPDRDGPVEAFHCQDIWVEDTTLDRLEGVYAWAHIPELPPQPKPLADEEGGRP